MKKLLCILALCLPFLLSAQVERVPQLAGTYNASQTGADLTTWTLTGTFADQSGTSDASNIQVGDYVFFTDGMYSFILPITEIVGSPTPPTITLKVAKGTITEISSVPTGVKGIYRSTIKGVLPAVGGLPAGDAQSLSSWGAKIIDSLLTSASGLSAGAIKNIKIVEASIDLTDSVNTNTRHITVSVSSGSTGGNVVLPTLHDSLKNITIIVQAWVNAGSTNVGVFTADGFITGYNDASSYHDFTTPLQQLANGEAIILKPLYDVTLGTWLWSNTLIRVSSLNVDAATPNILYVAKYGNDANPGTVYKPFLTIGAALTAATSGTLIYVREGTYSETELALKDNVNFFFESVTAGASDVSSEGLFNTPLFVANIDDLDVKISGSLTAYQLVEISKKRLTLDVDGYLIGQTFLGPGTNHASVNIRAKLCPSTVYQFAGTSDTITRNYVSYVVDTWTPFATYSSGHYPIAFFNNAASRPKLNNYNIEIGSVHMRTWADFYSNRGIIQARGVSAGWDSSAIRVNIGKGQFDAVGVNVANFGLLAFWPYVAATGNQLDFNCDDCLFYGRSTLFNGNFNMQGTDVQRITGKYRTFNKFDIFANVGNFNGTKKAIFSGEFYSRDSTLFVLANPSNFEFTGRLINAESDDATIVADWANGSTRPTLRNVTIESPATTPITSTVATTWYVADARETKTVTKDAEITFTPLSTYDDPVNVYTANGTIPTGTNRTISFGTGGAYGYMTIGGGTSNAKIDAAGYNYKSNADWGFNPYTAANATAGHGFANLNMYSRLYGGAGQRHARMYQEAYRGSTTAGYLMTNYMNIYMASSRKFFGFYNHMDSIGNAMISGIKFKSDSITTGGRAHFMGALKNGHTTGTERFYHPTTFLGLQTATYNSSTRYNWFGADDLDSGTIGTGNNVFMYGGDATGYRFPNATPSLTSGEVSVLNWLGTGSTATPRMTRIGDAITGTARIIPYMNSSGRLVTGNNYFKLDTTTTSGAQARVRLLINNPNGDAGEGDSYSALSVRAGDGLGTEAIFNIGDQAATMGTTGYGSVMQLSRSGGNFTTKSNLANGNEVGKFAWRGYVNGGSRALGHIQLNYVGDGTTYNSDLIGASAVSGSVVSGWKLDNQSRFWLGSGADDYHFPTTSPSNTTSDKNILIWTGTGSTPATPSFGTITGLMVDGQFTTGTPTLTAFGTGTAQRYVAVVELTSGASANTDIPLPTANVGTFGKSILISPRDLNTTYNINATGSIELNGASTASVILTKPTEFVCNVVSVGPTTYRWVMVDNATSSGSSSASTDGSGDVVITHNKNHTSYVVDIQGTGTTLGIGYTVTAKTATTFTVRAYDTGTKVAIASTGVTFDWIIKE